MRMRNVCDWCFENYNGKSVQLHTVNHKEFNLQACSEECFEQIVMDVLGEMDGGYIDSAGRYIGKVIEKDH